MKKWKVFLSFLFILIFITSTAIAANSSNDILVSINGEKESVREVPVVMDGQAIRLDMPSFITNGTTFVPVRFIAEHYGAEVDWEQSTRTATITTEDKKIELSINKSDVFVNGEKVVLDSTWIPKLVTFNVGNSRTDSRTMVPLRFVSETLGYEVGYDETNKLPFINTAKNEDEDKDENTNTSQVTNVVVEKGSTNKPKVTIQGTEKLNYSTLSLKNPTRLVIDIENATLNVKDIPFEDGIGKIDVNNGPIKRMSVSQFSKEPNVVRIVLNLTEEADFDLVSGDDSKSLTLSFVNKVKKIEKEEIDGKEAIVIHNTNKAEIRTMNLTNPERIVVDLLDSSLEGGNYFEYDYSLGVVKGVRVSQFVPDNLYKPNDRIVRMVLDIKDGITDPEVSINTYDDKMVIIPEANLQEAIDYSMKDGNGEISISTNKKTDYDVKYNEKEKTMVVEVPSDRLDIKEGFLSINDGLVNDITVKEEDNKYKIIVSFRRGIEYTVLSNSMDDEIILNFNSTEEIETSDKTIVIDAGHGGHDPGAVPNGVKEKDVNLAVALKLNESLRNKGYNTIMTRDDDNFVDLDERANIANRNQADIFISLHSNSIGNSDISGIQVLYCPAFDSELKEKDNYPLSDALMDEIIKGTGAVNKGILKRPRLVVLRKTAMPAALIEMGFLTNSEDAKNLQDDAYQDIMVDSIIKGIERYFETY